MMGISGVVEKGASASETLEYAVPAIHCGHCAETIKDEVGEVAGVRSVDVEPDSKVVRVSGESVDDKAVRTAVAEAGYEAALTVATSIPERVRLEIGGMTNASCATRVTRMLNKLDGVDATVNYATEEATVAFDPGYKAALPRSSIDAEQAGEDSLVLLRRRLLFAAALSLPLVVLAMVRSARFGGWEWLALALVTPVVLWSGWPFHRTAVVNARHLAATMDTLISIGTIAAWTWSTVVLLGALDADTRPAMTSSRRSTAEGRPRPRTMSPR